MPATLTLSEREVAMLEQIGVRERRARAMNRHVARQLIRRGLVFLSYEGLYLAPEGARVLALLRAGSPEVAVYPAALAKPTRPGGALMHPQIPTSHADALTRLGAATEIELEPRESLIRRINGSDVQLMVHRGSGRGWATVVEYRPNGTFILFGHPGNGEAAFTRMNAAIKHTGYRLAWVRSHDRVEWVLTHEEGGTLGTFHSGLLLDTRKAWVFGQTRKL